MAATQTVKQNLTPAQRANLFAQATRQYIQVLPKLSFAENTTLSFSLPKSRFLSKITLIFKGKINVSHTTKTSFTKRPLAPYTLINQIRLQINNGFNPYQVSGKMLSVYNKLSKNSSVDITKLDNAVSASGVDDNIYFKLDLPVTINDRDPIGLIMLQNDQTVVNINIDCGSISSLISDTDITVNSYQIDVIPVVETFTIPDDPNAIPDYSILKLVSELTDTVISAGNFIKQLPVGLSYRKILLYLEDNTGNPVDPNNINQILLQLNTAGTPYQIPPDYLLFKQAELYEGLPTGMLVFDFATQGIANLGGGRDYIDTERVTEFWLTLNMNTADHYKLYILSENLAKLS